LISGVFSNGISQDLGQIRLARFSNPVGLEQVGQNMYSTGVNSGLPIMGDPGDAGTGTIEQTYALAISGLGTVLPSFFPDAAQWTEVTDAWSTTLRQNFRIPVPLLYGVFGVPGQNPPPATSFEFVVSGGGGSLTMTGGALSVTGWELLDAD